MILRKICLLLSVVLFISNCLKCQEIALTGVMRPDSLATEASRDFSKTVIPLTTLRRHNLDIAVGAGTGFCLDAPCRFVATNYHVALLLDLRKIKGTKVVQKYFATGPTDQDATMNSWAESASRPLKYTLSRDLAILELRHPLHNCQGSDFTLADLLLGQEVDIYSYPKESSIRRRSLLRFHGLFRGETQDGLLAFDYELSGDKSIRPGASGGIVVDSKTQKIVGVLSGLDKTGKPIALAVPVQALADFVAKAQPFVAQSIFPHSLLIPPISVDFYSKFVPSHSSEIQHRPEEPPEIKALRNKAQALSDDMRNFIAEETFAWGKGNNPPSFESAYEVQVVDGFQRFREYDGKRAFQDVPLPPLNTAMANGGEWSELPAMVGKDLDLKIQQAPDAVLNDHRIKVFQYWADPEDDICKFESTIDFLLFRISKIHTLECFGEVWTDEQLNIFRISEHFELHEMWKDYQSTVTYGWAILSDHRSHLIPLTINSQAEFKKKIYWCRGQFQNYQVFDSQVKIAGN